MMRKHNGMKLRYIISMLVLLTILLTTLVTGYSMKAVLNETLTENYLNKNYEYAKKTALDTSVLIEEMKENVENLSKSIADGNFTQEKMNQWYLANGNSFNSIFSTDDQGVVLWMSPLKIGNNKVHPGTQLRDPLMNKALEERRPFISSPYLVQSGNLLILISHPVYDDQGTYKGTVGGTVYINGENTMNSLLGNQVILDNSSSFIVDHQGTIIFHTNKKDINVNIAEYPIMDIISKKESGSAKFIGNEDIEYFTGYAYLENTDWVVVSQTPVSIMENPLEELTKKVIINSLPLLIIILIAALIISSRISTPLTKLAVFSRNAIVNGKVHETNKQIQLKSSISEVRQLYHDIQEHIQLLTDQNQKDGLTGLSNRRIFDSQIKDWVETKTPFAVIMFDIDRFKLVNDTYGHLVGDDVLKYVANILQDYCREDDGCFRYGGEEFILLLKGIQTEEAVQIAEKLRTGIANTISPTGEPITISLGITVLRDEDHHPKTIIERADTALYHSKQTGRNRTTIYEQINEKSASSK
ncbi:sensor domain-containing diguanylate cyclase [Lysinibacillus yapensis]|uniref:Sensor domain-containing diguanylate cyclase n=1 Tax=Ureibacillus yapensis TaxID=2304605 RepID=A0A396S9Z1_9BACL|nr:sensor domain-containing diguanylate cyclase [Lysinibacillus yapensis]RHW32759.1 sensor domain-containing diguanylate cyclase [Lysinibacillus yapensis]